MKTISISEKYPFVKFHLSAEEEIEIDGESYVDTGAEFAGLFIPKNSIDSEQFREPLFVHRFTLADGTFRNFECFIGKVKIGKEVTFDTIIVLLDDNSRTLMGRDLLDKLVANFDGLNQKVTFYSQ